MRRWVIAPAQHQHAPSQQWAAKTDQMKQAITQQTNKKTHIQPGPAADTATSERFFIPVILSKLISNIEDKQNIFFRLERNQSDLS